ncbi:MAG: PQQ-binding-like beta-propeller repeat protein [Planctomycetaceae bacterium]|nr:PQQ-binding-like beta-propeller repeat protein [Planctomycetaceae bacterium]
MVVLFSGIFAVIAAPSFADDWASWRGPGHDGRSLETGLVETWNPETKENLLWESPIGGRAAPIIIDGRVYLDCRTEHNVAAGNPELIHAQEQVVCRDAATGEVIWVDKFNVSQTDIPAPRVGWASMVGDPSTGNVYLHSVSGVFRCYDRDGKVLWEHALGEEYGKISGYGGRTQTPIIDEDRIIVGFFGLNWGRNAVPPPKSAYYAFDKNTGDLLWVSLFGGRPLDTSYSNPVVAVVDGQRLLIAGGADGGIHAINARTGQFVWTFDLSKRGLNATPVVDGNLVYISHGEDNVDSLEFGRVQCIDARGTGNITKTNSVWRRDGIKAGYIALVVDDGVLYVVADTGKLHAFDSKSGEEHWEFSLGTVGKGSPVIADGKMYVMEVNGNIHILKVSRDKCQSLSRATITAANGEGLDEIYATPAISDGRIFFVTRDRTFCIGGSNAGERTTHEVPPIDDGKADSEAALIQLHPYEAYTMGGGDRTYRVVGFDKLGRLIGDVDAELSLPEGIKGVTLDGKTVKVAADAPAQGFEITAKSGELSTYSRLRTLPPLPWKWDFEGLTGKAVPPTWVNAFLKLTPEKVGDTTALKKGVGISADAWVGLPDMSGYTIQADVLMKEEKRKLPSIGLIAQKYNLILKGNTSKLAIQAWAPHQRIYKETKFRSDPDVWYTLKMTVQVKDDGAHILGKVWKQGDAEPAEWTIEAVDPHPSPTGSPGLYTYALAECYFDNVIVSE